MALLAKTVWRKRRRREAW